MTIRIICNSNNFDQPEDRKINNWWKQREQFAYNWLRYHHNVTLMVEKECYQTSKGAIKSRVIWACLNDQTRHHFFNVVFSWDGTNDESNRWKRTDWPFIEYALKKEKLNEPKTYLVVHRPNCPKNKIWIGDLCNFQEFKNKETNAREWCITIDPINMELSEVQS